MAAWILAFSTQYGWHVSGGGFVSPSLLARAKSPKHRSAWSARSDYQRLEIGSSPQELSLWADSQAVVSERRRDGSKMDVGCCCTYVRQADLPECSVTAPMGAGGPKGAPTELYVVGLG
jgi:hypothetical protein